MLLDWNKTLQELQAFAQRDIPLSKLNDLTIDTLYGSMYGLNHRYMTLKHCLEKDFNNVVAYSIRRIKTITTIPPITFCEHALPDVQQIGYGTYGWKYNAEIIKKVIQNNLLIDTAEGYGFGRVETALGDCLDGYTNVTTKVSRSHMSSKAIISAAKRSKEKLGIVPHYQLHFPHAQHSNEEIGKALIQLRREGIIQSIGLGNCSIDMIESMQSFLSYYSGDVIRSVQVKYNLADRRIEKTLIPYCQERGIAIIIYSPLGQKFSKLKKPILEMIAEELECTAAQVALAWILRHEGVIPIPRTNNIRHLKANIEAINIRLSKATIRTMNHFYPYRRLNGLL